MTPRKLIAFVSLAAVWLLLAQVCPAGERAEFENLLRDRNDLFASQQKMKFHHNWTHVIDKFIRFHKRNPKGRYADRALLLAGDLYARLYGWSGRTDDLERGLDCFARVVKGYPNSQAAPEAQYQLAETCRRNGRLQQGANAFRDLFRAYPDSARAEEAKRGLARLRQAGVKPDPLPGQRRQVSGPSRPVTVEGVRHWSAPGYTRLVIDLSEAAAFEDHLLRPDPSLHKPRRLYVDIRPARRGKALEPEVAIDDALVMQARAAQYRADTVRVVLDVKDIESYKVFPLRDPFRVVIDVRGKGGGGIQQASASAPGVRPPLPEGGQAGPPREISLAEQLGLRVARVVIDPGHGGKDPGASGPNGLKEKDVVLEIARALASQIQTELGCEVVMTRDSDIFLPLEERTAIANTRKGDLFISIHANACPDRGGRGVETYFLNFTTDQESIRVAARENATSAKNLSDLQMILNDLMLHSKINESSRLAEHIQESLVGNLRSRYSRVVNKGVKKAPFYVLIGAQMPAVLVETAFITNRTEARRLASEAYRQMVAKGILTGVKRYIEEIEMAARH